MLLLCALLFSATLWAQEKNSQSTEERDSKEAVASETEESDAQAPQELREEDLAIEDTGAPALELEGELNQFNAWDFLRMFLVLGVVISVIYGVFFFLKKMGNPSFQGNNLISLVSTQNLQGNRALHLIEVGNEVFLVGSSEGGVELVGKIQDQETLDQVRLYRSEMMAGGKSFQSSLRDIFFRNSGAAASGPQSGSGAQAEPASATQEGRSAGAALFLQRQRERLKNL